ncbi:hypothetical protein OMO38_03720 [Chryseobacterium sp. 09-1422]|uniref:Lipoprotein n=1 Tax=Chryseobacterium kimseyorum TaxID=2984028 RepID=A0ABT3HV12_9FLAO|nr:hypothetical protein [Chryseobacterium kimseyorum]MCW3167628.1 hypothetical protein [Chryseobacterium kimseyorum]
MKYSFTILILLLINLSCVSKKTRTTSNCNDYSFYYNYKSNDALQQIKDIPNLKEIDEQSFISYLDSGDNFEKIKKDQIVFVPESEFFQIPDRKGEIPLYVLGFVQNNNIKQYLVFGLHIGQNSSLYIINQVDNKITSMFSAHSNYNSGYGGENVETKKISDSIFNVKVFHSYDNDRNGNSSETCHYQLILSDEGYLSMVP